MQFTGISSVSLPQKSGFSFLLGNIDLSNATGVTNFIFADTGSGLIQFQFSGGFIALGPSGNKIISTYSTGIYNPINITGFYQSQILNYQINGIFGQQFYNFQNLNTFTVSGGIPTVFLDVYVNSNPINYSLYFYPSYLAGQKLTGILVSDTAFDINSYAFDFYGSNNYNLLSNSGSSFVITGGTNYLVFQDIDVGSIFEYNNAFNINLNAPFGAIDQTFISYRGNIYNQNSVNITDFDSNVYYLPSLFNGIWSGNNFVYADNPLKYTLGFEVQTVNLEGYTTPTTFSATFQPSSPINGSGYIADYITGFKLTNSGMYSGQPPTATFAQYYYVTGINQQFQNMLFSTGCRSGISVLFAGACSGSASGFLDMGIVNVSGIYGAGIHSFNIVEGYTALNSGSGFLTAPTVIWGTGGNCYSLPDQSGFGVAQFQKISGLQATTLRQVAGLTGWPLTNQINGTGYTVTGMQISNIGFGYNSDYPPTVTFNRWTGDLLTNNASGNLLYKTNGGYNFTDFWNISYNFLDSTNVFLNNYGSYYSGNITMPSGKDVINFVITLTGLDNTSPVSGLLTLTVPYYTGVISDTKNIIQSRYFNLNTGALFNNLSPISPFIPVPNFNYLFSGNQNGSQYINDFNNL